MIGEIHSQFGAIRQLRILRYIIRQVEMGVSEYDGHPKPPNNIDAVTYIF